MIDALIIGAGPTGLTLACELIKRGLSVRIVEQLSSPTDQSRALALHSRTLEIFEKMGLIEIFLKRGQIVRRFKAHLNYAPLFEAEFCELDTPYPFVLIVPQADTERILAEHFIQLGGKVERGISLQSLQGNLATLLHANGSEEKVAAKWIFGCDGAHSAVRRALSLPFTGAQFPETFALADVEVESPLPNDQFQVYFHPQGIGAFVPLPNPHHYRIIALLPEKIEKSSIHMDIAFFQHLLETYSKLGIKIKRADWMSLFTIHRRITPKMRVGNVFLLGDAAHIHSPIGGQGLNTSVQDAFNLAWKIGLVHQRLGKEILLDSYEAERYPVAKSVLRNTTLGTQLASSRFSRRFIMPLVGILMRNTRIRKKLLRGVSELNIAYPNSPIIGWGHGCKGPKSGERAPDAVLTNNVRLFSLLCHPLHTLICFGKEELTPLLHAVKASYSQTVHPICISPEEAGEAVKIYSLEFPCFYLIRPDGVIAYSFRSLDPRPFLSYLDGIFKL